MSEQLLESDKQIRKQATTIESVIENTTPTLYELHDCVKDIDATLDSIRPHEKVIIEHLGLDLTQAWQHFEVLLRKHQHLTDVDYRLLILTDDTAKILAANEEVKRWSKSVPGILGTIKGEVDLIINEAGRAGRGGMIKFDVKKYWDIPVVHGIRIVSPVSRSRCYMAICRWAGLDGKQFDWGPQYHKIIGDPYDTVSGDMLNIYKGYFKYLWEHHSIREFVSVAFPP
jgi:hypothetical protein